GKDIMASLRSIVGGEIEEYTQMLDEARNEALKRMEAEAKEKGANAIICIRFSTSAVMQNASEVMAYGTAVIVE
ncbi:YbjQ family protein, partial [Dehalococcoides mccartyi]